MSHWLVVAMILGGCGFRSSSLTGDGSSEPSDGSSDRPLDGGSMSDGPADGPGSIDGPMLTGCWQRWFDGGSALQLSAPQPLDAVNSSGSERDPWISGDGKRLYFARTPNVSKATSDIWVASRDATTAPFANPTTLVNVNNPSDDDRPALNDDETLLVFASVRGGAAKAKIFVSKANADGTFPSASESEQHLVSNINNNANVDYLDPFFTNDGLKLYVAPLSAATGQYIAVATRIAGQDFQASVPVPVINIAMATDADPALSPDERVIVFSSRRTGAAVPKLSNLWYATRSNAASTFGTPKPIPTVNGDAEDGDPMLSADGCELYFASTRMGGRYHIHHANVILP